ncbi:hypothetical protein JB92DRAFT_2877499 [Gautieria morchelliformis]|nr:hypothetical protein JB92DRAFT_2877499 [Gautieria morchelliformis]
MAAAHSIYADEMTSLMHGYPLWEPECHPEVSIADVGYIRHGRFCRLFNASLPPGDSLNEFGVPEGYEQLNLDERAIVERRLPPGPMASRSITGHGGGIEFTGTILQAGLGFQFSCAKDRGAVLIINSEARRKDSEQLGAFKKYMLKHYKSWCSFANNEPLSRDISRSDLVFVTGRDNTADWAVAAFSERTTSGGVNFQASYPGVAGAGFSIWGSWTGLRSMHANCGPRISRNSDELVRISGGEAGHVCAADLGEYDQCIFVRGLRVMDRTSQVRQKLRLKVSSSSGGLHLLQQPWMSRNSSGDGSGTVKGRTNTTKGSWGQQHTQAADGSASDKRDASTEVEIGSNEIETYAPVELLLAYMLQNSEASVAIAHDDDLAAIIKALGQKNGSLDFELLLSKVRPRVVVDSEGVGTISLDPPKPPNGHVEPVNGAHDEEQERINGMINVLQIRLNDTRDRLSLISKTGRGAQRRTALRAELGTIRDQQMASKASRDAMTVELKRSQEEIRVKIKSIQGLRKRLPATSIDELESKTRSLGRKVEAGNMGPSDEKKVVGQINSLKRSQTTIELYQTLQAEVDTNREQADRLRKQLDSHPGNLAERYEAVLADLDALQKESDEVYANREQLYRERDELQKQLSALHEQRRQAADQFREKRNAYWEKLTEDRAREAELLRAQRTAEGERKRAEAREQLLERARAPAFAIEIRDCRSLLEYFSSKADQSSAPSPPATVTGAERPPQSPSSENHPGAGWVPLKKKSEGEDFFIGGKGKAKKGQRRGTSVATTSKVSIPLGIMSTLISLAIAPPTTTSEIPSTIEDIKRKIEWFEANQTKATEENVARTEAELHRIGHYSASRSITV